MSEDWAGIAAEIDEALNSVGFPATLHRTGTPMGPEYDPVWSPETDFPITVVDSNWTKRDAQGNLLAQSVRLLTISALNGVVPNKTDSVTVRGVRHALLEVMPLAPGGVDLLYDLYLVS